MAVQDIQAGAGYLHGIAGTITITGLAGANLNIRSRNKTHNWTSEEISSQDGTIIEAKVSSKEYRDVKISFMPKSTTRALAETSLDTFIAAMTPNKVITIAGSTVTSYNGTYTYKGGTTIEETRDGRVMVSFNARQYKIAAATAGGPSDFAGLAIVSG